MTTKDVAIEVITPPLTVEERVRKAAEDGKIEALYGLIREKPGFLKDIDEMKFVDTPLHIAAAAGKTKFAMELVFLMPSFLTKLNQDGLSPIHLALRNEHAETVLSLLKFDKNLPYLKGKNCYTPLHYVVMKGDIGVLKKMLKDCPGCIDDVTNHDETALHVAAQNNNLEALRVLLQWLRVSGRSMLQRRKILNSKNRDGDTVLHMAAYKNQPEMIRLLAQENFTPLNLKATNLKKLTALDIAEGGDQEKNKKCIDILRAHTDSQLRWYVDCAMIPLEKFSELAYEIRNMSGDRTNALLVATVLILTATYQAALSPPGGVFEGNFQSDNLQNTNSTNTTSTNTTSAAISWRVHSVAPNPSNVTNDTFGSQKLPFTPGSSVLSTNHYLGFFIPNTGAFCVSFFVTCLALIQILPGYLSFVLVLSLSMLGACLLVSEVLIISPEAQAVNFMVVYVLFSIGLLVITVFILIRKQYKKSVEQKIMRDIRNNKS